MAQSWVASLNRHSPYAAHNAYGAGDVWSMVTYNYYEARSPNIGVGRFWLVSYRPNWYYEVPSGHILTSATVVLDVWTSQGVTYTLEVAALADPRERFNGLVGNRPAAPPPVLTSARRTVTLVGGDWLRTTVDVRDIVAEVMASPHWAGEDRTVTIAVRVVDTSSTWVAASFLSTQSLDNTGTTVFDAPLTFTFAAPPVASFNITDRTGRAVSVTDTSQAVESTIVQRHWDWGDGTTSTTSSNVASKTYTSLGTYTVTLTITRADGGTATTTRTVVIDDAPAAAISAVRRGGTETLTVDAIVQASVSQECNGFFETDLAGWFGSFFGTPWASIARDTARAHAGHSSMRITPLIDDATHGKRGTVWRHVSALPGASYSATVRVWLGPGVTRAAFSGGLFDSGGFTTADTTTAGSWQTLTITGTPTGETFTPTLNTYGDGPVWVDTLTTTPDTLAGVTIASVSTTFGDTSPPVTGTGTKTHSYTEPGTYSVSTTVTDSRGHRTTASNTVTVVSPLSPRIATDAQGLLVTLDASGSTSSLGTITSWLWDHGDGTTSTGQVVTHRYTSPGDYTVRLTISDETATVSLTTTVTVSTITTAAPDSPAWTEALNAATREIGGMVEIIDDTGKVIAILASPEHGDGGIEVESVTRDGNVRTQWSATLTVAGEHIPVKAGDWLHDLTPVAVRLWWLIAVDGGWLRTPVGTYIAGPAKRDTKGSGTTVTVPLLDRLSALNTDYLDPIVMEGMTAAQAIAAIVRDCLPIVDMTVEDNGVTLPDGIIVGGQGTPLQDVAALCTELRYECYTDPYGIVRIHPIRRGAAPVATWREGDGCVITSGSVEVNPADRCNQVRVYARSDPSIYATAQVDTPGHPLNVGAGRLYRKRVESEFATSLEQCLDLANDYVRAGSDTAQTIDVTHTPNPTLAPGDAVLIDSPAHLGVSDVVHVARWSLPGLGVGQQSTTMRDRSIPL